MMPAWTGPTATSWTSPPSTRKKFPLAGAPPSPLRTGFSHGWPSGVRPCCSQTSRSNRCACGWVGVSADTGLANGVLRATASVLSASKAITATSRVAPPSGTPNQAQRRAPRSSSAAVAADEFRRRPLRHLRPRKAGAVGQQGKWSGGAHGGGKSWATAAVQASRSTPAWPARARGTGPGAAAAATITPAVSRRRVSAFALPRRAAGRPRCAKTTRVRPKKASSRQPRNIAAAAPCPVSKAARTTSSSLKNGPKGGQAVTANIPATKIAAERGVSSGHAPHLVHRCGAGGAADVARAQKQRAFGQAVGPDMKQRRRRRPRRPAPRRCTRMPMCSTLE